MRILLGRCLGPNREHAHAVHAQQMTAAPTYENASPEEDSFARIAVEVSEALQGYIQRLGKYAELAKAKAARKKNSRASSTTTTEEQNRDRDRDIPSIQIPVDLALMLGTAHLNYSTLCGVINGRNSNNGSNKSNDSLAQRRAQVAKGMAIIAPAQQLLAASDAAAAEVQHRNGNGDVSVATAAVEVKLEAKVETDFDGDVVVEELVSKKPPSETRRELRGYNAAVMPIDLLVVDGLVRERLGTNTPVDVDVNNVNVITTDSSSSSSATSTMNTADTIVGATTNAVSAASGTSAAVTNGFVGYEKRELRDASVFLFQQRVRVCVELVHLGMQTLAKRMISALLTRLESLRPALHRCDGSLREDAVAVYLGVGAALEALHQPGRACAVYLLCLDHSGEELSRTVLGADQKDQNMHNNNNNKRNMPSALSEMRSDPALAAPLLALLRLAETHQFPRGQANEANKANEEQEEKEEKRVKEEEAPIYDVAVTSDSPYSAVASALLRETQVPEWAAGTTHTRHTREAAYLVPPAKDVRALVKQHLSQATGLYVLLLIILIMLIESCHGYPISLSLCPMVIISRAPIEWCIGEPIPVFFYRILQYH